MKKFMPNHLGSLRVLSALDDIADLRFDTGDTDGIDGDLDPEHAARLWYYQDLTAYLNEAYERRSSDAFERRRSDLATKFAAIRARRAGHLSDLGWCPTEPLAWDFSRVRQRYHWWRRALRAYETLCREQATVLRRLAKTITQPLPAPRVRPPVPPQKPYTGVHPDHLSARLLDLASLRCTELRRDGPSITARWGGVASEAVQGKLRVDLDYILAPAKVVEINAHGVTMRWAVEVAHPEDAP